MSEKQNYQVNQICENPKEEQFIQDKYSQLTNNKLFDNLNFTRKYFVNESFDQGKNDKNQNSDRINSERNGQNSLNGQTLSTNSPQKEQFRNKTDDFVSLQIQEISKFKKDNLHFQLRVQELENYKTILEDQLSQKNQYSLEKETRFQDEINRIKEENSTQRYKIQKLEQENRDLQDGITQIKFQKDQELEQQKINLQKSNQAQLNRDIKDLSQKHSSEYQLLYSETQKEKEMRHIYQEEIKILQQQSKEQQYQIMVLRKLEDKLMEKEQIILCLHSEIDSKIDILEKKNQELENLKYQHRELEIQNSNIQKENFVQITKKDSCIKEYEQQLLKLKMEKEHLLTIQTQYYEQEVKLKNNSTELNKINGILLDKNLQLEKTSILLQSTQQALLQEEEKNRNLELKEEQLQGDIELGLTQLKQKKQENYEIFQKLNDQELEFNQFKTIEGRNYQVLEEKMQSLVYENGQQKDKLQENQVFILQQTHLIQQQQQSLQNQSQKLMGLTQELSQVQEQLQQKLDENEILNSQVIKYKPYQNQCKEYENQLDLLVNEIQRLNRLLIDYINENEQFNHCKLEIQRFISLCKEQEAEIQQLEIEVQSLMLKNNSLQKLTFQCNDQENLIKSLKHELERNINQIQQKNKEIQLVQFRNQENENQNNQMRSELVLQGKLQLENECLKSIVREKEILIESFSDQNQKFTRLQLKQNEYLTLFVLLFAVIDAQNKRLIIESNSSKK